jgi:hypothetical protein
MVCINHVRLLLHVERVQDGVRHGAQGVGVLQRAALTAEVSDFYFDNFKAINVSIFHGFGLLSELCNNHFLYF